MPPQGVQGEAIDLHLDTMDIDDGIKLIRKERIDPLLKFLKTGEFENKTKLSFMTAYSVVHHFSDNHQHLSRLYGCYKEVIHNYCFERVSSVGDLAGEELLKNLADLWQKQTRLVFETYRVFQYLDIFFTGNNNEFPKLFDTALKCFQDTVYDTIKDRCVKALVNVIDSERNGNKIDQEAIRSLVQMFCTVGETSPKVERDPQQDRYLWQSHSKGRYKDDFETVLLVSTAEYYQNHVAKWLSEYSCPAFVQEATKRLADEEARLSHYLDRSSAEELRTVCQRELILATAERLVGMDSGCKSMFEGKRYSELEQMFKLFNREHTMLPHMTGIMERYIESRVSAIVESPQIIENAEIYIQEILALLDELKDMVSRCFNNHTEFQKSRNLGLETRLNKDTRCAKALALFCDLQLKNRLKDSSEEEVSQRVTKIVDLLAHLRDKDIFLDFYKTHLSKRLLNKTSFSKQAELLFIEKLQEKCGMQSIKKLSDMMNDMGMTDDLQREYSQLSHGGKPRGITHEVKVLRTNVWPEKSEETNIVPCEEMAVCAKTFEAFYDSKFQGRKLRWFYSMGTAEVSCHCFNKKHIVDVSTYQALALMVFNKSRQLTFAEIKDATKMSHEECHRQVLSMTAKNQNLLVYPKDEVGKKLEDATTLQVNELFSNDKVRVNIKLIKGEQVEPATVAEPPAERKHHIDAAIVRIMKEKKQLEHLALETEVIAQCPMFRPQPPAIKAQIESLIEREYLGRDPNKRNLYNYLP